MKKGTQQDLDAETLHIGSNNNLQISFLSEKNPTVIKSFQTNTQIKD